MQSMNALRAAVARADEVLGCGAMPCRFKVTTGQTTNGRCMCLDHPRAGQALAALYKAAKAAVEEAAIRRMADGAINAEHDGDSTMFAEAFKEVRACVQNASVEAESRIVTVRGLELATLEPYLNREVEFMGVRGAVTGAKMTSSCMTPMKPIHEERFVFTSKPGEFEFYDTAKVAEPRCEVTTKSNEEVRRTWEATLGLNNVPRTCWCFECLDEPSEGLRNPTMVRMIVCPQCGNKRCPRATSHDNACSGSNEPGQDGSEK